MTESKVIDLRVDVGQGEAAIASFTKSIAGLEKELSQIGSIVSRAFQPLIQSLDVMAGKIQEITHRLTGAASSMNDFKASAGAGQETKSIFDHLADGYNGLISLIDSKNAFEASNAKIMKEFETISSAPDVKTLISSMLPKTTELFSAVSEWAKLSLADVFANSLGDEKLTGAVDVAKTFSNVATSFVKNNPIGAGPILDVSDIFSQANDKIVGISGSVGIVGEALGGVGVKIGEFGKSISGIFGSITTSISGMSLGWGAIIALVIGFVIGLVVVIVQNWDAIKAAIGTAAEWLNTNVIQPIVGFCTELWTNITTIISGIWNGIVSVFSVVGQWIYDNVIVPVMDIFSPIIEWYAQLFGSVWQTISDIFYNIGVVICGCWEIIKAAWAIVATWFNENVIQPVVQFFVQLGTSIAEFATNAWTAICNTFSAVGTWFYENVIKPVGSFISDMWNGFLQGALNAWEGIKSAFSAVAGFFGDIFGKAWAAVVKVFDIAGEIFVNIKDGILSVFKTIVNGLIDGINAVVAIPFKGINGALSIIKNIEIVGITPFSDLRLLNIPKIPHLAQGAVLPANRPFMAIVGDQRHGTNVEAPLATIQEAVAIVMEDQTQAIVAGFNASIGVQRELLSAVLGIRIGDEVIGRAADRYFAKRAAMGGY